jgi:hypothetical protein
LFSLISSLLVGHGIDEDLLDGSPTVALAGPYQQPFFGSIEEGRTGEGEGVVKVG